MFDVYAGMPGGEEPNGKMAETAAEDMKRNGREHPVDADKVVRRLPEEPLL